MSIFGSLFKKQKSESQGNSSKENSLEAKEGRTITFKIGEQEYAGVIRKERYPARCPYVDTSKPYVCQLAQDCIWKHNTQQETAIVWKALNDLYRYVQQNTGMTLIDLTTEECQSVGHAFSISALCYRPENGDLDYNSVAGENAFYCLYRCFNEKHDVTSACFLWHLLQPTYIMGDKLIEILIDNYQKKGYPLGLLFQGRNPYRDPALEDFRQDAYSFRLVISKYLLDYFYDETSGSLKDNVIYLRPSVDFISRFLKEFYSSKYANGYRDNRSNFDDFAKQYMFELFKSCEDTLRKY